MKNKIKSQKFSFFLLIILMLIQALSVQSQTIGNNAEGTLNDPPGPTMCAIRYQSDQNMTVTKMYVKIATSGSGNIKCAIYSDNSGNPGTFLMGTNELTNPGTGWRQFDLTSGLSLTSGTWYHLVLWTSDYSYQVNYTSGGVGTPYRSLTYGTWPSSFGATTSWPNGTYCIYATGDSTITLGNTGEGTLKDFPAYAMCAVRYQCAQDMYVTKMYVKIGTSGSGNIKCAIYSDNNGSPGTFLMGTNELTNPGTGWKSFNLTTGLALTSGTWYHLVEWSSNTGYYINYTSGGVGTPYRLYAYGTWPSSFGATTPWPSTYCIYAEGTGGCTDPAITSHPQSITRAVGTSATFSVTATGTNLTYQWKKGGTDISGAVFSSYTISSVASGDAGDYTVVVSGACGSPVTSNTATLTVSCTNPAITSHPQSITRAVGTSATFSVTATGTSLTYQWKKGGTDISGATSSSYTISSVATGDAGNYTVVVSGACGSPVTSNTATLTVGDDNIHYIDPDGSDATGNGTIGNPWKSLYKACNSVTTSGHIIHVNEGTYYETSQCILAVGVSIEGVGTASNITTNYVPGGSYWLGGLLYLQSGTENTNGNQSIHDLKFDGLSRASQCAIAVRCRGHVNIYNCTFVNFQQEAVIFYGGISSWGTSDAGKTYAEGNTFHDNITTDCSRTIESAWNNTGHLLIQGQKDLLIYNNTMNQTQRTAGLNGMLIKGVEGFFKGLKIYNNTMTQTPYANEVGFAMELWYVRGGCEIYNNNISLCTDIARGIIKGDYAFSVKVHDNTIGHTSAPLSSSPYGVLLEWDNQDVYIYNNFIKNVVSAVTLSSEYIKTFERIYIYYNICQDIGFGDGVVNFYTVSGASCTFNNINIFNNVMHCKVQQGMYSRSGVHLPEYGTCTNFYIKNNIIENSTKGCIWGRNTTHTMSNLVIQNNIFYGNANSDEVYFENSYSASPYTNSGNIKSDPLFVGGSPYDFYLQTGSPAIDNGLYLTIPTGQVDYNGVSVEDPPEIGAYECDETQSASLVNQPTANPDLIDKDLFVVYPNPVKDMLTIALDDMDAKVSLKLYDSKGIKLYEGIAAGTTTIDMSSYAPGLYIMHVEIGGILKIAKIIK